MFIFIMVISSKQGKLSTSPSRKCNPALQGNDSAECLSSHRNLYGRELLTPDFQGVECEEGVPGSPYRLDLGVLTPGQTAQEAVVRLLPNSLFTRLHFLLARIQLLVLNKRPDKARLGFSNL
jgi:hypothetical protein